MENPQTYIGVTFVQNFGMETAYYISWS